MSREARPRYAGITRSKPPVDRGALPSWQHSRFAALGLIGLCAFLASCSGGAGTGESQPTVLESAPPVPEESPNETAVEEGGTDPADVSEDETEDAEPVPASSEGPAENWPEPEIPEEIYEPTEEGAEALIQYWFDARHHARITGDVDVLEHVSLPECELCNAEIGAITDLYPDGWYLDGRPDEVVDVYTRAESDKITSGLFELRMHDFETYVSGDFYSSTEGNPDAIFGLDFRYEDGRWQAYDFNPLGEAESIDEVDL